MTVQDLWFVSKKNIIMNSFFQLLLNSERVAYVIKNNSIKYFLINQSSYIFDRFQIPPAEVLKNYKNEKINLIYEDKINKYYL